MNIDAILNHSFFLISACLFLFASNTAYNYLTLPLGLANALLFLGIMIIRNKKIKLPNNLGLYSIFLGIFMLHTIIFHGQIMFFLIFLLGTLYWIFTYNFKSLLSRYFNYFLIFFGLAMTVAYVTSTARGVTFSLPQNLFLPLSPNVLHNHLGDLWAIILVFLIYYGSYVKRSVWQVPVILIGAFMLIISFSRSALLSLAIGVVYIARTQHIQPRFKYLSYSISILLLFLFLYFGIFKTALFSRPYFLESLTSLVNFPLGNGVGNFYKISQESALTHNIILEFVSGMGVLSVVFILWLVRIFKSFFKRNSMTLYKGLFLALFINFLFDTTYVIPSMIWLWFSFLGLLSD